VINGLACRSAKTSSPEKAAEHAEGQKCRPYVSINGGDTELNGMNGQLTAPRSIEKEKPL
jgi:hypothetical protein